MNAIALRHGGSPDAELSLQDIWHVLMRNRLLIVGCAALVVGLAALWAFTTTPVYEASTSIRIDEDKSKAPVLEALQQLSSDGSDVVTEMEVLKSRSLAEDVVDSLGLRAVVAHPSRVQREQLLSSVRVSDGAPEGELAFTRGRGGVFRITDALTGVAVASTLPGQPVDVRGVLLTLAPTTSRQPHFTIRVVNRQKAVTAVRRSLNVSRPERTANVLVVDYEGIDPRLVREVPNVLAKRFIAQRQEVQKIEARSEVRFLRQQLDTLTRQLSLSQDTLQAFREQARVVDLPEEAKAQVGQLADLEGQRASVNAEREALATLLSEIKADAATQAPGQPSPYRRLMAFPTLFKNIGTNAALASLSTLEDERANLLARRTHQDPDVQALDGRIQDIEGQLRTIGETYLLGLTNQVAALDGTLAQFGQQLERVPAKEIEYARLERRPKILEDIFTLLQTRLKEAEITQAVEDPSVRVVDAAILPMDPIRPNKPFVLGIAAMLGLMLGVGAAFTRELSDRTVHTRDDVSALTGATVLGLIPRIRQPKRLPKRRLASIRWGPRARREITDRTATAPSSAILPPILSERLITGVDPRSPVSEAYRSLRTNITFARPERSPKTLVFTSPMPGDGKTTSAANLAITLAQQGLHILLVDADLRRGVLNGVFGVAREPGLSNVLVGAEKVPSAIKRIELGDAVALDFLSTGTLPPNPAELLGSEKMRQLLRILQEKYDAIILDTPPLNVVTDAAVLGTVADGVVLIARAGVTDKRALMYAAEQLTNVRASVVGTVLNDVDFDHNPYYGSYGPYAYYRFDYTYQMKSGRHVEITIPVPSLGRTSG